MKKTTGWDELPSFSDNKNYYDFYEAVELSGEYEQLRLIGDITVVKIGWIPALKKNKGVTAYPVLSLLNDGKACPLSEFGMQIQTVILTNSIVRSIQEQEPDKKKINIPDKEFREPGDKFWSPIRVLKLPSQAAQNVKNLGALNKVKSKDGKIVTYPLNHPKFGRDILIKFDRTQSGSAMYSIQKDDDRSPLTEEEKNYLLFNLENVFEAMPTSDFIYECIMKAYNQDLLDKDNCSNLAKLKKFAISVGDGYSSNDNNDEDFEMEEKPKKKTSEKSKVSKKKDRYEEDEEDIFEEKKVSKKDKYDEDLDFEDEEGDEGFDDIDDEPKKVDKKKTKYEDDEDDFEESNSKRPVNKRKPKYEDEEDEEKVVPERKPKRKVEKDEDDEEDTSRFRARRKRTKDED